MFESLITSSYYRVLVILILVFWLISSIIKFDYIGAMFVAVPLAYVWDTGALTNAYNEINKMAWSKLRSDISVGTT